MTAAQEIAKERERQLNTGENSPQKDAKYDGYELENAATAILLFDKALWPFKDVVFERIMSYPRDKQLILVASYTAREIDRRRHDERQSAGEESE